MKWSTVRAVWAKELRDALRDPRATFYLVGLPLLFYPALLLLLEYIAQRQIGVRPEGPATVALSRIEEVRDLAAALAESGILISPTTSPALDVAFGTQAVGIDPVGIGAPSPRLDLYVNTGIDGAAEIRDVVLETLQRWEGRYIVTEITIGPPPRDLTVTMALFPYFLVVLILVGAAHMAIDVTAGEKERRTLETLLVAPASRADVLAGKAAATLTASLVSGALGMIGLMAAVGLARPLMGERPLLLGLSGEAFLVIGLGSVPAAFFLSALLLTLGTAARSSREGQTYAAYLQMPLLLLALSATFLSHGSNAALYLVPVLGTNLAQKAFLAGEGDPSLAALSVATTLVLTALLTLLAARWFASERVLFRE